MNRRGRSVSTIVGILVVAILGAVVLMKTRPRAERRPPMKAVPLVRCQALEELVHTATLEVMGTVVPAAELRLKARVSAEVMAVHANWYPGGLVAAGEELVRLDDADYVMAVAQAKADVAQVRSDLSLERT